jgi:hypothetical protein
MKNPIRLALAALLATYVILFGSFGVAAAAPLAGEVNSVSEIQLSALSIQLLIGLFIPLVVGLATKYTTSSGFKALLMLVLNAVQTLIVQTTMADGTAIISKETFIQWLMALVISVSMYAGVYKPLNLTSSTPEGALAPNKGL